MHMSHKLGQHFLINKTVIPKIIATLDLQLGETVVEIGPGKGALTLPLVKACQKINCQLVAIEKDLDLMNQMKDLNIEGLEIIPGDALKILPKLITNDSKLVGNIPYYITGQLLRILSEAKDPPKASVLMVQEEVAERICSKPPKMNLLSAITQFWAEPELILRLKPADFDPPPKVDSAVIKLTTKPLVVSRQSSVSYYRLVKIIFKQPRKTAANNLADGLGIPKKEAVDLIESVGLPENSRPQNFNLDQLIKLSTITAK
ncbi:MAG: 16S rRNA (adenine1518-N6/adenine1519-N6)-dimethyltransferase [Parcubacteria group bacterium Gr01-1014_19]|nr:MAG: 16S rRNA (adenine1518-N6/adenine1519-N6)-dimethyltransferase [Parcubacteria group bacterium Gr01-1014_19]